MSAPVYQKAPSGTPAVDGTGLEAYSRALGITSGSTDGSGATPTLFKISPAGTQRRYYLGLSNTLSIPMAASGILTSSSSGSTTLTIPTFASMGFTRDPVNPVEMSIQVQRGGLGGLFVNPATGVTITWNDLDPQYMTQDHAPVRLTTSGDNRWYAS